MARAVGDYVRAALCTQDNWKLYLLSNWDSIIGTIKAKVTLEKIDDDTLVLGVYDACWMQELYLLSHVLLATINQRLDQPRIKHLRFKRAGKRPPRKSSPQQSTQRTYEPVVLTEHEKRALATVDDPHLREALSSFLIRCYREKV